MFLWIINFHILQSNLLNRDATKYILGLLAPLQDDERGAWLEKLIDVIQKQGLDSTNIDKAHVEKAAKVVFFSLFCVIKFFHDKFYFLPPGVLPK